MKGFSFDSFLVHDTNKAAYDICHKLAAMEEKMPRPIVLLGESGSGKSHLLWAIVNHFRELNAKVSVALISSKDFPGKIKCLPENPEKLQKKYPVILLVDELHLFEKDVAALERLIRAFREYNQYVVIATNIHPSMLPAISDELKSYINEGEIVTLKPLPKSEGAPIPEVAIQQIVALKARVAELEAVKGASGATSADAQHELYALRQQLEKIGHERDVARTALEHSEGELIDLREKIARLQAGTRSDDKNVEEIVDRLEKQKGTLVKRIASLEQQLEELLELTHTIGSEKKGEPMPDRNAQLPEVQKESDLLRVVDDIRETLKHFEQSESDGAPDGGEPTGNTQKMLATIASQLRSLEKKPAENDS